MSRLHALVIVHLIVGVIVSTVSGITETIDFVLRYLPVVPVLALALGGACLVSIWTVLGGGHIVARMGGCFLALAYLETMVFFGCSDDDFNCLVTLSAGAVAAVLIVMRRWIGPLREVSHNQVDDLNETFQFSIQSLMLVTFLVAVGIVFLQTIESWFGSPGKFIVIVVWAMGAATMGLCSVWAMMCRAKTGLRAVIVFAFSVVVGALIAYGIDEGWEVYVYLILITALQSAITLASLLVVRSAGYRLMRHSVTQ